jgi:eukaryotic-like serine/threonine-protein kinase
MVSDRMRLGKYQLVAELARGGMGVVYIAVSQGPGRFNKLVAIKELRHDLLDDEKYIDMFLEEARLAARLSHPNIIQTYEVGEDAGRRYLVMDYLDGVSLNRLTRRKSPRFTLRLRMRVLSEVLAALHYAHTLEDFDGAAVGVVHNPYRGATPQNIFLTGDGQVKLLDFGVAKGVDSDLETVAGEMKGKPAYMAPEQIRGVADLRSDVFAIGVVLWEAVAGRRMWDKGDDVATVGRLLGGDLPVLPNRPDIEPELVAMIDRALQPKVDERFQTALEFKQAIDAYLAPGSDGGLPELGKLVTELFAEERGRIRKAINTSIRNLESGAEIAQLPLLNEKVPHSTGTPTGSLESVSEVAPLSATAATPGGVSAPSDAGTKTNTKTWVLAGGGIVAAVAVGIGFSMTRAPHEAGVSPAPLPVAESPEASHAVVQRKSAFELRIAVQPPNAELVVDGKVSRGIAKVTCTEGERITVQAQLAGYIPFEKEHVCAGSGPMNVHLEQQPRLQGTWPPPKSKASSTAAVAEPPPKPIATANPPHDGPSIGKQPLRPVDTANPYGN